MQKAIETNNGLKGGLLKGKAHYDSNGNPLGGIKAVVTDQGGKPIEVEGNEVIINKKTVQSEKVLTIKGTPKEILSTLNQMDGNGVAIGDEEAEILAKYRNGGELITYKNKYNKKYGYSINESHNLEEISEDTGVSIKGLQEIYNKGIGAYKTNPTSVRPNVKSKEQWAMARVYSAVMGGKASIVDKNELKMVDKYHLGGDMSKHLAPNGKPSKLTHEQWHLVRSPEFIEFFGDWINSPETASKVIDEETKEPLVVYHGTEKEFTVFDLKKIGEWSGNLGHYGYGFYFSYDIKEAKGYGSKILNCFLNIKKPFLGTYDEFDLLKDNGFTGIDDKVALSIDFKDLHNKMKSIDMNAYNFMSIAEKNGLDNVWNLYLKSKKSGEEGKVDLNDLYDILSFTDLGKENNSVPDFIIEDIESIGIEPKLNMGYENPQSLHWVTDLGNNSKEFTDFIKTLNYDGVIYGSEYVALNSNQIKLADGTNTTFDSNNPDIRFDKGGGVNEGEFIIEELDEDSKQTYQILASKNIGGADFFFSRLNIYPLQNVFTIELPNGEEIGRATLNEKENYLTNIRVNDNYRRKGLALNLYNFIEYVIGKKLKPSPDKISTEAKGLWAKRNTDIRFAEGGLIAPNGKKSNLTTEQYKLVRTDAFKNWFGEWENDPENASKVVDKNGEPLILFQGQAYSKYPKGNYIFDKDNQGIFFTSSKKIANTYGNVIQVFVNARNLKDIRNYYGYDNKKISEDKRNVSRWTSKYKFSELINYVNSDENVVDFYEGIIDKYGDKITINTSREDIVLKDKQALKDFIVPTSPEGFKYVNHTYKSAIWNLVAKYVRASNYDGIICTDEDNNREDRADTFIVYNSNQVKLADGTNTTFDESNDDIRFAEGGSIPEQGTLYTKDKKTKLEYIKNGSDYEFIVYESEDNPVEGYSRNQYKRHNKNKATMNYNQFVDFLHSESYLHDKFKTGGSISKMTPSELKEFYASPEGKKLDAQTYSEWDKLVNMTKSELEKFYNSVEGKKAGLTTSQAKEQGIDSGRESARWIIKMKDIPYTKWSSDMWRWAKKQIGFIKRMTGMRGKLYNDKGEKTRKHTALLIWGHNPEQKFAEGGEISKNVDNKLKELGFEFNKFNYRYGKQINEQDYITAFYSEKEKLYKIRGNHKFTTPLGENSVGIQFDFNNEKEFYNKIQEYLSKSINNPEEKFKGGGDIKGYDNFKNPILINGFISNKEIDGKEIFLITYNSGGQEGLNVHQTMNPLAMLDAVEKKTGLHTNALQVFIYEHTENSNRIETEDELEFLKDNYTIIIVDRDSVEFYNGDIQFKGGGYVPKDVFTKSENERNEDYEANWNLWIDTLLKNENLPIHWTTSESRKELYGDSFYITIFNEDWQEFAKLRFSGHSVMNTSRLQNEFHNPNISRFYEIVSRAMNKGQQDKHPEKLVRFKGGGELSKKALAVETNDLKDFVRKYFIGDGRIDVSDAMQELFGNKRGKSIAGEYRKRIGLHKKGGLTISQLAHNLWEEHQDEVRGDIDDSDFRAAVEDVLISEYGVSSMIKSLMEKSEGGEQDKESEFWMNQFDEGDDEYYEDLSDEEVADYFKDMEGFESETYKDEDKKIIISGIEIPKEIDELFKEKYELDYYYSFYGKILNSFPKDEMGLTTDSAKNTKEYKDVKQKYDLAKRNADNFNTSKEGKELSNFYSKIDRMSRIEIMKYYTNQAEEIAKGTQHEMEHLDTLKKVAEGKITPEEAVVQTAKTHIKENPEYYEDLAKMEEENKIPKGNLVLYTKLKGDIKFKASDFRGNQVGNLVYAPLVKPEDYLRFKEAIVSTSKENPNTSFRIVEIGNNKVWYDSENEPKQDLAKMEEENEEEGYEWLYKLSTDKLQSELNLWEKDLKVKQDFKNKYENQIINEKSEIRLPHQKNDVNSFISKKNKEIELLNKRIEDVKKSIRITKKIISSRNTENEESIPDLIEGLKVLAESLEGAEKKEIEDVIEGLEILLESDNKFEKGGEFRMATGGKIVFKPITTPL